MSTVDLALALEALCPQAQYYGSLTTNTAEAYGLIKWNDTRPKPDIEDLLAYKAPINPLELLAQARAAFIGLPLELQETYQTAVNNILIAISNGNPALGLKNLTELQPVEESHRAIVTQFQSIFGLASVQALDPTRGPVDAGIGE